MLISYWSSDVCSSDLADVCRLDAEFFVPQLQQAFADAQAPGAYPALAAAAADPRLATAMQYFDDWAGLDFQAKTGILEGFDAEDDDGDPTGRAEERRVGTEGVGE